MPNLTKAALLTALASLLSTAAAATDPVFAPGQTWTLSFPYQGKTMTRELVVSRVQKTEKGMVFYESDWYKRGGYQLKDAFKYDPVDTDPEYIEATLTIDMNVQSGQGFSFSLEKVIEEHCYVRKPGRVKVGQALPGLLIRKQAMSFDSTQEYALQQYVTTGKLKNAERCTLKRVK